VTRLTLSRALRWVAATCFSSLFLALLAQWRLSEGCNVFREPVGSAVAIRALPEEKPRLPKKTGPELDSVRPLKSPVSPSAPTRPVALGSAPCLICALG
jgi:hypothetical protein